VAWRDAIPDIDPYYNALRTGLVLAHHVWDCLVDRDPDTFQIRPLLATTWRQVDGTTIDFTLRSGVTFHDGSPFTADDVVYTINTAISDKQVLVPTNYLYLAGAEKLDDLHVRVKLKRVFPAALEYLAMTLPILPKAYRERVGPEAFAQSPIGTGPYRITHIDGRSGIDLERYGGYFPRGPKGSPAIRFIQISEVADASAEMTALLSGRADWIWNFNPDQFENIAAVPTLQALRSESMRIAYLSMDAAGRTGADNPLTKRGVRQAIAYAIDRQTIARRLVQGVSRVIDAPCYPTQFGCDPTEVVRYPYNPTKAKQLLADEGYPNGFSTELVTYLLPEWVDAIHDYLQAVGIETHVTNLQAGVAQQKSNDSETPLFLGSWGSYSINDVSAILPYFFAGGNQDYTRDPEVEALVKNGGSTDDVDERRKNYAHAIQIITANADWLPLYTFVTTYGVSRTLNFTPYPDELPRFYLSTWR
jgi:peptide/nickel transport system substrate-binding protein